MKDVAGPQVHYRPDLSRTLEHILSLYPFAEISILGDFNIHHLLWLSPPFTDHPGDLALSFARATGATPYS
ncbi:hypothetical protein E2C01_054313 [Portunus trituberculatus]|uniref:Endonuclease/exonuclease/phosphatase domain-containing protein n=1 Tax=Portunus trituberculatus TaxID=210409 RepID=A0A5B7GUN4_PORTR|nr:hypothetical protein [Portunus trituberculatus]